VHEGGVRTSVIPVCDLLRSLRGREVTFFGRFGGSRTSWTQSDLEKLSGIRGLNSFMSEQKEMLLVIVASGMQEERIVLLYSGLTWIFLKLSFQFPS